jgi:hypothetical protein
MHYTFKTPQELSKVIMCTDNLSQEETGVAREQHLAAERASNEKFDCTKQTVM